MARTAQIEDHDAGPLVVPRLHATRLLGGEVLRQRKARRPQHARLEKLAAREMAAPAEVGPVISKEVKHGDGKMGLGTPTAGIRSAGKSALWRVLRLHPSAAISFKTGAGINCLYYSGAFRVASSDKPEIETLMKCGTH